MMPRVTKKLVVSAFIAACAGPADHASGHPHARGDHHGEGHHHDFSDVERFAAMFDDPARDEWQRPADVVRLLEVESGATIVDLGAGTGYFARHLSPAAGASGRVIALDTEPAMVEHMRARFEREGLANAEARTVAGDDPALDARSVDRILIVDTWHHLADRTRYAERLRDALREGGFVLVVDFSPESPHGPPPAMRLSAETIASELEAAGLRARVVDEPLPYQYAVRADLPPSP
jgi:SAM-dependent methyltransferase